MKCLWIAILIFFFISAFGQKSARVRELEKQRKEALADIETTNQLLNETKLTEKSSLSRLNLLSKQLLSRQKVITLLTQEVTIIDAQITKANRNLLRLERELAEKKSAYQKSVRGLYRRHGSMDKMLFVFSADNFAQSVRRMRYLKEYADWQRKQAAEIIASSKVISQKRAELEKSRIGKNKLLSMRETEANKLKTEEVNQKKVVVSISKKQKQLKAQLQQKQRQANMLNKQIEKLIADEIARVDAEAKALRKRQNRSGSNKETEKEAKQTKEERTADTKGGYAMTKAEKQLSNDFSENKGRLPYPLTGKYTVVGLFGEQQHQELKYVRTNNSGIDIQTTPGSEARSVFKGEVTRVFVVPGYNNSVILRHGNYLTVYSNLSEVYVKAGDKVSTKQAIGKIYTDTEDSNSTILHFQLWKEKVKLNPTPWLD